MRRLLLALTVVLAACGSDADVRGDVDPSRQGLQGRVAQFVVECELSHMAFDDPIVLPDNPGKSHLHQFFGNREVDADPTYNDRVLDADTTCDQRGDTASYWAPALLDPEGKVIEPLGMTAYHRPGSGIDPADVVAYPAGLMLIGGDQAAKDEQALDVAAWSCGSGAGRKAAPVRCPDGSTLRAIISFPDCWDGDRLTAFGSSAHVRYSDDGCPDTHPVAIPQLTIGIDYPPVAPDGLSLASGGTETLHADFWNVWDQSTLEREVERCINRNLVCDASE